MNPHRRNKFLLLALAGVLVVSLVCVIFFSEIASSLHQQTLTQMLIHKDTERFGVTEYALPTLGNKFKHDLELLNNLSSDSLVAFESFDLNGKRVNNGIYDDYYVVRPVFGVKSRLSGTWHESIEDLQTLTNGKSDFFYFNIRRQHFSSGRIKDHLVLTVDNIDPKYCLRPIREAEVIVAASNKSVVDDESYSDGCARKSDGTTYFFASVAQREKQDESGQWQWVQ